MTPNFFDLTSTEISAALAIFNLSFVLVLELALTWIYKKTHKGIAYSQSFVFTLLMMGLIVAIIVMTVVNNLIGAFALLGAFAIIRFRTIVKETRDVAFLFLSLAIGVAIGTGNYALAIIATVFIGAVILILDRYNFGSLTGRGYVLTFLAKSDYKENGVKSIFNDYFKDMKLLHIKGYKEGEREFAYLVKPKEDIDLNVFVTRLEAVPHLLEPSIITGHDTTEY